MNVRKERPLSIWNSHSSCTGSINNGSCSGPVMRARAGTFVAVAEAVFPMVQPATSEVAVAIVRVAMEVVVLV